MTKNYIHMYLFFSTSGVKYNNRCLKQCFHYAKIQTASETKAVLPGFASIIWDVSKSNRYKLGRTPSFLLSLLGVLAWFPKCKGSVPKVFWEHFSVWHLHVGGILRKTLSSLTLQIEKQMIQCLQLTHDIFKVVFPKEKQNQMKYRLYDEDFFLH